MPNRKQYSTIPIPTSDSLALRFLYETVPGRLLLKLCVKTFVSRLAGWFLNSRLSAVLTGPYIRRQRIDMEDYENPLYRSFNEFFTRKIRPECRPASNNSMDLLSPCDGKLTAYPITEQSDFSIKHRRYTTGELTGDCVPAREFTGGTALIFRLVPSDYHRYCFIEDGVILEHKKIPGVLHTVRPIAHRRFNVYGANSRECTVIQTTKGHTVAQVEVGAMLVGKINNHKHAGRCRRGEEKGMFEFGGSTVVLLFQKDAVEPDEALFSNTEQGLESVVKQGETIGRWNEIR